MSFNSLNAVIRVAQDKKLGSYQIKVVGTLPDKQTTSFTFTVNIIRRLISKVFIKIDLIANMVSTYHLANIQDNSIVRNITDMPSFVYF